MLLHPVDDVILGAEVVESDGPLRHALALSDVVPRVREVGGDRSLVGPPGPLQPRPEVVPLVNLGHLFLRRHALVVVAGEEGVAGILRLRLLARRSARFDGASGLSLLRLKASSVVRRVCGRESRPLPPVNFRVELQGFDLRLLGVAPPQVHRVEDTGLVCEVVDALDSASVSGVLAVRWHVVVAGEARPIGVLPALRLQLLPDPPKHRSVVDLDPELHLALFPVPLLQLLPIVIILLHRQPGDFPVLLILLLQLPFLILKLPRLLQLPFLLQLPLFLLLQQPLLLPFLLLPLLLELLLLQLPRLLLLQPLLLPFLLLPLLLELLGGSHPAILSFGLRSSSADADRPVLLDDRLRDPLLNVPQLSRVELVAPLVRNSVQSDSVPETVFGDSLSQLHEAGKVVDSNLVPRLRASSLTFKRLPRKSVVATVVREAEPLKKLPHFYVRL